MKLLLACTCALCRLLCGLICAQALTATIASAGELRIVDNLGLARAVKSVDRSVSVHVSTKGAQKQTGLPQLKLVNIDGLASELIAKSSEHKFVFSGVTEGTWRIVVPSPETVITEVKIDQ